MCCGWTARHSLSLSSSATSADQRGGRRPTCGKNGLLNICVYPRAKTNRLYLPQSNIPSTERSQEKKDVAWDLAYAMPGRSTLSHIQTEKTLTSVEDRKCTPSACYQTNVSTIWTFTRMAAILWFILFPEKTTQIGKQHLEGIWPLREWEKRRQAW